MAVRGWKGLNGEDSMSENDWNDRAARVATGMIHGVPHQQCVPDEDGTPTYGVYNDDYSEQEHENALQRYEEDSDYAQQVDEQVRTLNYGKQEGFF